MHARFVTAVAIFSLVAVLCYWAPLETSQPNVANAALQETADDLKPHLEGLTPEAQLEYLGDLWQTGRRSAAVSFYLGNAFFAMGLMDSALAYYQTTIVRDSTFAKAYVNLGIAWENLGNFDEARVVYERVLEVAPDDVLAHCHLGHHHYVRGRKNEAMAHYRRALEIDPNSAQARYNLGLAFADAKLFKEAIVEWRKVIELTPDTELGQTAGENVKLIEHYLELEAQKRKR